jgi:hypothetical protein
MATLILIENDTRSGGLRGPAHPQSSSFLKKKKKDLWSDNFVSKHSLPYEMFNS